MKTILITGASRGIGLATTKRFLVEGWKVIGTHLNNKIPVESPNLVSIQMDQGSKESINEAVQKINTLNTKLDVLVNNAAVILDGWDDAVDLEKIRKTFEVNLFGIIDFTEQLLPLIQSGGHIINLDSLYGAFSFPVDDSSSSGYRMTKAALNMYTRTLAFGLKDTGIIVSSLDPGWVKTDMGNAAATEDAGPDRDPSEPADDIYKIVTTVTESGCFWKLGEKREW